MKRALRNLLLAACLPLAACETVQALQRVQAMDDFQSGGPAAEPPLTVLAFSVNPTYTPDGASDAPNAAGQQLVQRFAQGLAQKFPADFPDQLRPYGVAAAQPGKGVPLLRLYIATARSQCYQASRDCETQARLDGTLIGASGRRDWWFNYWVTLDDLSDKTYPAIYRQIVAEMAKAQVVVGGE